MGAGKQTLAGQGSMCVHAVVVLTPPSGEAWMGNRRGGGSYYEPHHAWLGAVHVLSRTLGAQVALLSTEYNLRRERPSSATPQNAAPYRHGPAHPAGGPHAPTLPHKPSTSPAQHSHGSLDAPVGWWVGGSVRLLLPKRGEERHEAASCACWLQHAAWPVGGPTRPAPPPPNCHSSTAACQRTGLGPALAGTGQQGSASPSSQPPPPAPVPSRAGPDLHAHPCRHHCSRLPTGTAHPHICPLSSAGCCYPFPLQTSARTSSVCAAAPPLVRIPPVCATPTPAAGPCSCRRAWHDAVERAAIIVSLSSMTREDHRHHHGVLALVLRALIMFSM